MKVNITEFATTKIVKSSSGLLIEKKVEKAKAILTELEKIATPVNPLFSPEIRILVFNYFGCLFRRINQRSIASIYLEKAKKLLHCTSAKKYQGMTYINLTAFFHEESKFEYFFI